MAWNLVLCCISFCSPLSARPSHAPRGPVQQAGSSSGGLHFVPRSCVTMSDSFVLLGSLFVKETCFDHPLQVSPLSTHSATSPCGPLCIPLFTSCLLPLLACKTHESRETMSALLLPYCGIWQRILALSRESTSTCVRG